MLRTGNPEMVAASNLTACWAEAATHRKNNPKTTTRENFRSKLQKLA
jgi:hypothetical protein